tara:strand:- start:1151 stop:1903 length:753 start_codon:yes stop_codon:yes gene_type:complete
MLVSLANNQTIGANSSATYTYSPTSVQKILINMEDADSEDALITVQIGSTTICNGIMAYGLLGLTTLESGTAQDIAGTNGTFLVLDFGNHECQQSDNLYVTVQAGSAEVSAVDVSALVDTPGQVGPPLRLTQYSDNTFTSNNNISALSFDSAKAAVDEDAYNIEIRTSISSSAPSLISANSYYQSVTKTYAFPTSYGLLNVHSVPLSTTYNYSASAVTDRIITVEQMAQSRGQLEQARKSGRLARSQAGK